jgi:hypothetical protein
VLVPLAVELGVAGIVGIVIELLGVGEEPGAVVVPPIATVVDVPVAALLGISESARL